MVISLLSSVLLSILTLQRPLLLVEVVQLVKSLRDMLLSLIPIAGVRSSVTKASGLVRDQWKCDSPSYWLEAAWDDASNTLWTNTGVPSTSTASCIDFAKPFCRFADPLYSLDRFGSK